MPGLESASGIQRKGMVLATLSKLKQVCNHPAQFFKDNSAIPGRSGKLTRLVEMLEEVIEGGECALVFSQFAEMGAILKRHLEATFGREVLFLHGGVPKARRDEMVARFHKEDGAAPPIFVLSLKAGGTGSTSPPPATCFISIAGGTRRSRTRRPTGPFVSGSSATSSSARTAGSASSQPVGGGGDGSRRSSRFRSARGSTGAGRTRGADRCCISRSRTTR